MHYHAEVWLPELKDVHNQIEKAMAPFSENDYQTEKIIEYDEEYWRNPQGFWDWWQIGGRWTGAHTGYDPYEDERNVKRCLICGGTGFRNDQTGVKARRNDPSYTCNGCGTWDEETGEWKHGRWGAGRTLRWSTDFEPHLGDMLPVGEVKEDLSCYTLIVKGQAIHKEIWNGSEFKTTGFDGNVLNKLDELGITDGYLVTVDYHC